MAIDNIHGMAESSSGVVTKLTFTSISESEPEEESD